MEDKHRQSLRKRWSELRKDLEPKRLLPYLVDILDVVDEEEILSRDTREQQVDSLLELLPRRGPMAFQCFIKALESTQPFLASSFKHEKEMEEMRTELNKERVNSSKMCNEIRLLNSQLESEKQKHDRTKKEMHEVKSIHQSILNKTESEKQQLQIDIQELQNSESSLKRQLEEEQENKNKNIKELEKVHQQCKNLQQKIVSKEAEMVRLKCKLETRTSKLDGSVWDEQSKTESVSSSDNDFPPFEEESISLDVNKNQEESVLKRNPNCREFSFDQNRVREKKNGVGVPVVIRSNSGTKIYADELATTQGFQEIHKLLAKISKERDEARKVCKDLEKQIADRNSKESEKSFEHRTTSPMETVNTTDPKECELCLEMEKKCKEIEKERDHVRMVKTQFHEEIKQLNNRIVEIKEKQEREKRRLQDELRTAQEACETFSRDHAEEVAKLKDDMNQQRLLELQDLQVDKAELCNQLEKSKAETHRLKTELDKEKQLLSKVQKEFELKRKKLLSDKKELKQKIEDESKMRMENVKDLEKTCHEYEEKDVKHRGDISRLQKELFVQQEKMGQLMEQLERWRTLPGRVHNYRKDFDRNGVIYALGTNFGHSPWVNPGNLGKSQIRVTVSRSSHDQGKPVDLLENRKGTLSCTKDEEGSWWCLDLGPRFVLFPTQYTIRHGRDNGLSIVRNWKLEGSLDNRKWWTLKRHENDRGFKGTYPFYTATWSIDGEIRATRYFRIYQTGKNSSGRHSLYLSGLELYGVLLDMGYD